MSSPSDENDGPRAPARLSRGTRTISLLAVGGEPFPAEGGGGSRGGVLVEAKAEETNEG